MRPIRTPLAAAALALVALLATGARPAGPPHEAVLEHAEATRVAFGAACAGEAEGRALESTTRALDAALAEVARLGDSLDLARPASELARLDEAAAEHRVSCSPELWDALTAALDVARESEGAYDPTVVGLARAYDTLGTGRPDPVALAEALRRTGWRQLQLEPGTRGVRFARPGIVVDLAGVQRGFALDRAIDALRASGVKRARLVLGDVSAVFADAGSGWALPVPDPADPSVTTFQLTARMGAVATAGSAVAPGDWVIDPRDGARRYRGAAVTVVARSAARAAGLARALLAMGRDDALRFVDGRRDLAMLWLEKDGSVVTAWRWNLPAVAEAPDAVVRWMD